MKTSFSQQTKGVLALIILAFGFGAIAITVRYLSLYYTLFQQLYLSIGAAFVLSLIIFPRSLTLARLEKIPGRDWGIMLFRVIIGYLIGASLYRQSLTLTKISNVTFIQSIPFGGIYGWLLFKEKFTLKKLVLLAVAYIGVVLIAVNNYSSISNFSLGRGELFSLVASALFSLSYVSRKWITDYLTDMEITQILLFLATVLLFLASLISGEGLPTVIWQTIVIGSLVLTGLFNTVNMYLINYGFRHVEAVVASNILALEAIFALILAFIFYKELPTLKELFGGVLIIVSVVQMNRLAEK